jgi:soluble lytic murein transglycosylase
LKHVLETLDNQPVLASAGYNAGPGRARAWRAAEEMESAIYAETIPFNETRDYVKKVMANATFYARTLGQHLVSLKERIGSIPPPAR